MSSKAERQTYSPADVVSYLGISPSNAYRLFRSSEFPSFRIGGRWMVTKQAFEEWLKKQQAVSTCN